MDGDGNVSLVVVSGFICTYSAFAAHYVFDQGGRGWREWVVKEHIYITIHGYILKYLFTVHKIHLFVTTWLHKSQFLFSKFFAFNARASSIFCFLSITFFLKNVKQE